VIDDLIYDVGMHLGEDTAFYLAKGFRVVAIEASPELAAAGEREFAAHVADGSLHVVNAAVAETNGPVELDLNPTTEWNTTNSEWVQRNLRMRPAEITTVTVEGMPFRDILTRFGTPYFLKVDIEGADLLCVEALRAGDVPKYVSLESDKTSWRRIRLELELLARLGYDRFKVVGQHRVPEQVPPRPAREGRYVEWKFEHMASGLFGEEAPGRWLTRRQALALYWLIFVRYRLYGDDGIAPHRAHGWLHRLFGAPGWYDTHATRLR
jgi:FkbM family methyltransferase